MRALISDISNGFNHLISSSKNGFA